MPRQEVTLRVGEPAIIESILIDSELVHIELSVHWNGSTKNRLLVKAIAFGPSHWKTERLEEKMILDLLDTQKS